VRELEGGAQDPSHRALRGRGRSARRAAAGELSADGLLGRYGALLYRQLGSHAEVSRCMGVDVRTARKYVESAKSG